MPPWKTIVMISMMPETWRLLRGGPSVRGESLALEGTLFTPAKLVIKFLQIPIKDPCDTLGGSHYIKVSAQWDKPWDIREDREENGRTNKKAAIPRDQRAECDASPGARQEERGLEREACTELSAGTPDS